ncbi:hypothetical protein BDV32DRAFT_125677 [Aspergillus pseudonomiae]|nr:hypothetical protein BDV32DRAFT_125677 [Aspergillus pseudonomiae]
MGPCFTYLIVMVPCAGLYGIELNRHRCTKCHGQVTPHFSTAQLCMEWNHQDPALPIYLLIWNS